MILFRMLRGLYQAYKNEPEWTRKHLEKLKKEIMARLPDDAKKILAFFTRK